MTIYRRTFVCYACKEKIIGEENRYIGMIDYVSPRAQFKKVSLCQSCLEMMFERCSDCGNWYLPQSFLQYGDRKICYTCESTTGIFQHLLSIGAISFEPLSDNPVSMNRDVRTMKIIKDPDIEM